ncbi:GntR family transcriptional regulator [Pedobacter sp. KBW01]|uniref:winged helix-turn-helix domain-containing protein n=1 Tax=Pedobacter sp. KBW01 TaxID=2153364 RepID=UPI000F5B5DB9|nr:winged helix-turn-helix domain-containing protein [Pedobacter sp. KBW01]RQO66587.1 GntR family transcriptional regulator [Pedobacter sp. KBW01]
MLTIFEKIQELEEIPSYSKHEQFVQGIINAIDEKIILKGAPLPSISVLIKNLGFARETIMKGYRELISRGIVESKSRLGYFVANDDTEQTLKVALLMYLIDSFQEQFYRNFRNELGPNVHIDVFFHHGNITVFETMLDMIKGKYGVYVISPIPHPKTKQLLETLPGNKLIMFDRYEPLEGEFNFITQEFEQSTYKVLSELAETIMKFDEMILFHTPGSLDPIEIIKSFKKFAKDFKVNTRILNEYKPGSVEKGKVYFTLDNSEIWKIMKDCEIKHLEIGEDIGILSHNDEIVKEIVGGGLTTYSADFSLMGKKVAQAILKKEKVQEIIPTVLIRRKSL